MLFDSPEEEMEEANPTGPNDPALLTSKHESYRAAPDEDSNTDRNSSGTASRSDKSISWQRAVTAPRPRSSAVRAASRSGSTDREIKTMRRGADKIAPGGRSSLLGVRALLHRGDSATASAMARAMALPIPRDAPTNIL
jgi:hypothetical protein